MAEWISESFLGVTSIPDMWEIGRLNSDAAFGGEVGIVTPADIFSRDIVSVNSEFLNDVSEVVMIEPSLFVGTSQLSISLYISEIRKSATFYIIDKNSDGLVDTMSHIVRQSIKEVSATTREKIAFPICFGRQTANSSITAYSRMLQDIWAWERN